MTDEEVKEMRRQYLESRLADQWTISFIFGASGEPATYFYENWITGEIQALD